MKGLKVLNAVIYARYSTDNQNPDTIEVQVEKCNRYALEHGYTVIDIFADEAVSGMLAHRPEYDRFISCLHAGIFDIVLIYDQSRMFRDMVEWFTFRRVIDKSMHSRLISVTQPLVGGDLNDPAVFASEGINALVNQIQVLQTRQKVVEKMNYMARQGIPCGGVPPLGYDVIDKTYVINEEEAETVRIIFSMYANGFSYEKIIDSLNADGRTTKRKKSFGKNSLFEILRNEKYIGNFLYNKSVTRPDGRKNTHAKPTEKLIRVENAIPPIISKETWNQTQRRKRTKNKNASNTAKANYLLTGKVYCGTCGMAMTGERSKRIYHYYGCSGKKRLRNCDKRPIQKDLLEQLCAQCVQSAFSDSSHAESIAASVLEYEKNARQSVAPDQKRVRNRLNEIDKKLENLNLAIASGIWSASTKQMLFQLEDEKHSLLFRLSEIEASALFTKKSKKQIIDIILSISLIDSTTPEGLKSVLAFIKKVYIFDDLYVSTRI